MYFITVTNSRLIFIKERIDLGEMWSEIIIIFCDCVLYQPLSNYAEIACFRE